MICPKQNTINEKEPGGEAIRVGGGGSGTCVETSLAATGEATRVSTSPWKRATTVTHTTVDTSSPVSRASVADTSRNGVFRKTNRSVDVSVIRKTLFLSSEVPALLLLDFLVSSSFVFRT